MGSLIALGECMVELSPAGEGLYRRGFAGDTFNTAWYARRLLPPDWTVAYGTCVGTDALSDQMLAFMAGEGIDTAAVRRLPDRTVGLYMISLTAGERSFSYWRGQSAARALADDPDALEAALRNRDFIHFSGISLAILTPSARDRLCAAIAQARAAGARVVFDTNLRPRLWEGEAAMRAGLTLGAAVADIVLPSFDEEAALFGDTNPDETLARYRALGAGLVVVKQGAGPVMIWDRDAGRAEFTPKPVARVLDTTAAGDSFAAGLIAGLACGMAVDTAARAGIRLAAQVIQAPGALVPGIFGQAARG
ncbi:sugar kinase [Rhodovulum euryhalinum]|uniref:2-dehydro-3-deoxygluconokinase n=1 Tax=Rhodovulum euryhalinum TaxID=35805 RepID=A0A4V2SAD4_9RHOB|nr:sugar kinase [Rhodovulum euryhalinum]TCO71230.1 2-keto-3-deoxygluconate kinase [Rhodovulum euryhalinum]